MNYGEVLNLLIILLIVYSLLLSLVIFAVQEFLFHWRKIGISRLSLRIITSLLAGPLLVLAFYYLLYSL